MLTETEKRRIWERAYDAGASRPYDVLHAMEHLLWYWYEAPDDTREDTAIRQAVFALGETRPDSSLLADWEIELLTWGKDDLLKPPPPSKPDAFYGPGEAPWFRP